MKTNLSLKDELLSAIRRIVAKFWAQEVGQLMRLQSVGYHAKLRTKSGIRSMIGSRMLLSTLLMLTVCIGNAWADSYTIAFSNSAGSATAISSSVGSSTTIASAGRTYVTSTPYTVNSGNCYYGGDGSDNIRIGKSGNNASLSIALSASGQVSATTIVVNCMKMSGNKNASATLSVNGASAQAAPASANNLTFTINDDIESITLSSVTAVFVYSITVNYSAGCSGTKLGTPVVTATPSSGQVELTWPNVSNASSYKLKWNGGDWETAVSGVTKSGTNGTSYTYQVKAIGNGTDYCDGDPSAEASVVPGTYYTVTFMNNGSTYDTKSILSGSNLVLPDNPSSCDVSKEFVGWSTNNIGSTPTDTKPTTFKSTFSTISANTTLYAVFAKKTANSYKLGDANDLIEEQKVLIVNQNASQAMSNTNNSGKLTATGVSISSNTISSPAASLIWTVELDGATKYKFKNTYYVYAYSTSTVYCDDDDSTYPDSWTLTDAGSTGKYYMHSDRSTSSYRLEDYNSKFYPYTSGTTEIFKQSFFVPEYTKYVTECCTQLGSINGSVKSISGTGITLQWDDISNVSSWAVSGIDVTNSNTAVPSGNIGTPTDKGSTYECAISSLTAGHQYKFSISATASSGYCDKTQEITVTTPLITLSETGLSGMSYIEGFGPSTQTKTFTVTAVGLTGNLTVSSPTNFQVSTDNSSWGSSKTISHSSGSASGTVYVRLASGLSEGSYGSASTYVTVSGGSATTKNVSVQGSVSPACAAPTINTQPAASASYNMNMTATALTVVATKNGTGPALTYQWYSNTANSKTTPTPTLISGAMSSSYTPTTSAVGTKYYFCEVSSGACAETTNISAITVNTPTITVSETARAFGDRKVNGGPYEMTFTVSGSNLAKDQGIGLAITGTNAGMFAIKNNVTSITQTTAGAVAETTVTVQYSPTGAGSHSATLTLSSTSATSKAVALTGTGKWEVTWNVNGGATTSLVANGTKPTLPSPAPSSCDLTSTTFIGWATSSWSGKLDDVSDKTIHADNSTMSNITANGTTFYAVFAKAGGAPITWDKVASMNSLSVGDVFVFASGTNAVTDPENTTNPPKGTSITVNGSNQITSTVTDAMKWTFAKDGDNYTFYPNGDDEKWLRCNTTASSSSNNNMRVDAISGRTKFAIDNSGYLVTNDTYTDRYFSYYSDGNDFRGYTGTSNGAFVPICYKRNGGTTYSEYLTSCCDLKAVAGLTVSGVTGNSVTLTWTAPSSTTGIDHLELRNASTDAKIGSNIAVGTTTTSVSGLTECTTYTYKIVSVGASCETSSETVEATPYSGAKTVTYKFHDDVTADGSFSTDCTHSSTTLPNPSRTGYTLNGWYTDASGGTKKGDGGASYTPDATITLHAQWSQTNYTVTMAQSPSVGATLTGGTTTAHYGNTINISTSVPSGYRFSGWTSSPSVTFANASATSTSFSMPASNVTVTANFVQIHTLTFTIPSGGGSAVTPPATADHGGTVTLPSTTGKSSEYSCETFLGWTTMAPNGSGTWATTPSYKAAGATSDAINANTTFYAVYSRSGGGASGTVELTGANIGTFYTSHTELQSNGNIAYGNSRSITVGDYTWTTNGFQQGAQTSDYYLNLRERTNAGGVSWLQIPTMPGDINSITFSVTNGGSNSTTNVLYFQSGTTSNETVIATSENTDSKSRTLTISGSYTGGYITANGTIRIRSLTVSYGPAPIVSHTLECGCAIAQFDLTYNANTTYFPGSTTSCSGEDDYVFASHDDEYTICSTEPTLDGYKFTGWTTNANGSGDHFDAGEVVSCMPSADVTLYAQYERVYTITFNNQGSTTPVTQGSYGAAIDVPNATTPCNDPADPDTYTWAFVGWSKTAIAPMSFLPTLEIEAGTETYTPEEDLTLYAIYRKTITSDAFVAGASGAYKIKATSSGTDYYAAGYSNTKINATTTSGDAVTYYIRYNSVGSNYTIQQADGKYIAYKGNTPSGSNPDLKLSDDAFYWSISSAGGGLWAIQSPTSTDANTRYLQLSAGTGFKAYTDNVNPTFVAAEASFYYRTMSCASDFDITFQTGDWTINWAVGHPEASYKHLADATEVSTFPTASYNGWTFLGWRVSEYAGSISAPDGASIYGGSNGTSGNTYTIASTDVVMYPVFTQFLDNAPFDTIYGGNYYIYYIADGDISTSQDVYGANNRIYAGSYSSHAYTSTPNCGSATSFTFTKLPNGKWTIYDNNNNKYLLGESSGNDLYLDKTATAANYGEWTITVHSGNQFEARCQSGYALSALTSNATSGTFKDYSSGNFSSNAGLYHRIYLGTCTERMFTTDPVRNATITINGDVKVTSTASKAIKSTSVLSVTANNIDETTLSVSSNNSHFTVNPSSITVTNHQVAATSVTITYTPAADATTDGTEDATITVSDGAGTSEEVTVTGRHLPADFVIAAKIGDNWYALPADCSTSSSSTAGVLIEVDNASDPTCATGAPENTKYGLLPVRPGRVSDYGSRLVFTEHLSTATTEDQKTLYNGSTTSIQVDAMYKYYANTNPEKYEWIPATSDLKDYTLTSATILGGDAAARTVSLNTSGVFGTLLQAKAYDGKVRLLPATFYTPAAVQILKWKASSVIVMYAGTETSATTKVGTNAPSSAQTLSTHKLTHGIYELTTDQALKANAGQTLTITLGSTNMEVEIPLIIATNTTASANGKDVVILDGYKFTAAATKYTYRNIYVYGGGKLDIPTGTSLGVNNIILRAGGVSTTGIGSSPSATYQYVYPQVNLAGTLTSTQTNIKYEYVTDYYKWYHLVLPFNANRTSITYPQEYYGTIVAADNHGSWQIKRYDGATRATGDYDAWVDIESAGEPETISAGHGYIFWGAPKKLTIGGVTDRSAWGIQRITMPTTAADAMSAETANKSVTGLSPHNNVSNASSKPNDQGWNLIGNPYMVNLTGLTSSSLRQGQLEKEMVSGQWTGKWIFNTTNSNRYITVPDNHFTTYEAIAVAESGMTLTAGCAFFVQLATDADAVQFDVTKKASLAPMQWNAVAEQTVDIETGIVMTDETLKDEVDFWIKDDKTEAYEFNADYPKTPNQTNFNIYGVHETGKLSWIAISPEIAEGSMAIGYQVPAAGDYTLSLSEKFPEEKIEALFVTDHAMSPEVTTNLTEENYTFTVHQAESNDERFTVSVKLKKQTDVVTDIGAGGTTQTQAVKFIHNDKLYILRNGLIYDATGKRVSVINK